MRFMFVKAAALAAAAMSLAGAALAAPLNPSTALKGDPALVQAQWDGCRDRRYIQAARPGDPCYRYGERGPGRYDDRGPGWREGRGPDRPHGGHGGWSHRPDGCRMVVTRRVNGWGEAVVRRVRVCR